ncbi:MAG: hypothetical protein P8Z30_05375 [Acidobacteriota bacterium]
MRAVWSFWSRPFYAYYGRIWAKPLHHLLAWGLSVSAASRYYPDTVLVTDRAGKRLLVDQLGLSFAYVSTELERLEKVDPGWWALGKLVAYSLQDRPFIHLDTDVFLWKSLPRHLAESPVFAQYPEGFYENGPYYRPQDIEWAFSQEAMKLPKEWVWARTTRSHFPAANCGILGGSDAAFLRYFARTAIDLIMKPRNAKAWARLPDKRCYNIVIEQFFLSACLEYHRYNPASPYQGVRMDHLFACWEHAFDPNHAARIGFTHLVAGAKSHPTVGMRIEQRARRQDPSFYNRCERLLARSDVSFG